MASTAGAEVIKGKGRLKREATQDALIAAFGRVVQRVGLRNVGVNAVIKEAAATLDEQGLTVDKRHIMLVADIMTNDGDVKAIGRHGISGRKSSVLARAAFEITSAHLLKAGLIGEVDRLDGVAENIIVGQPVTVGTGAVNLIYSPPKTPKRRKE